MLKFKNISTLAAAALLLAACSPATEEAPPAAQAAPATAQATAPAAPAEVFDFGADVSESRLLAADNEPGQWMSNGRDYGEQRFSPLDQLNTENVNQLSLAWSGDIDTSRGQEATPIVVDGALYVSTAWSHVKAFDVRTGAPLWSYDPEVDPAKGVDACCDVVNRGVAVWDGKVFVGTLDGRLVALDSKTGEVVWSVVTLDQTKPYTITGAPRIIKGQVIIGNGGAEYGVRGYITAYDAKTGEQNWRYYTVPGNPADGFEQPELEMAAQTWNGEWWKLGGGGTVWDSMAYDADLNLLYIGVGNGSPWNQSLRSPGGGDNLFLSSIMAINPDDGTYRWHYQTTPGETWDYTATQHIIVATLRIDGQERRVVMQAPKNGFFYVLDAETGQLLSAEKFVPNSWATHIDLESDRPVEIPEARYNETGVPIIVQPSALGGHNWHPMSFSQRTNLVYLAARENIMGYSGETEFITSQRGWNTGTDLAAGGALISAAGDSAPTRQSYLLAWNPVTQTEAWRVPQLDPTDAAGVLSTAGGLVFQGNAAGEFVAYRDDTGERLWSGLTQAMTVAAPVTFLVDGVQHVAVLAGGRSLPTVGAGAIGSTTRASNNNSRVLVFKIGGTGRLPSELPQEVTAAGELNPPPVTAVNEVLAQGEQIYGRLCSVCHGPAAISASVGTFPDLRYSPRLQTLEAFESVVVGGELASRGMVSFDSSLEDADAEAIRQYVIAQAHIALEAQAR
ncbi:MAG: PQQ-dependent dehydrogenase, methanol/ethanol family [Gammaproteobacteria bacterium]|nr:PQQ-dependent dehydrogenase, methanol/ethanol family [Gammaproteobacteria bacterium]